MWQESDNENQQLLSNMTDVAFRIQCEHLPIDHAAELAKAICALAPQVAASEYSGIHSIHVAGSQNGWERPERTDAKLLLSKRTRLRIRIETGQAQALIDLLSGSTIDVQDSSLHIIDGNVRPLAPSATLLARYVYFANIQQTAENDETQYIERVVKQCTQLGYSPTKVMCGLEHIINTDNGPQLTRSVLLADVPIKESIMLQDKGIGSGRTIGCGLLIPHKDTQSVHDQQH